MERILVMLLTLLLHVHVLRSQHHFSIKHYTSENGLPQSSVKNIAPDSEGFIWLATEDGLVRFDGQRFYVFNEGNLAIKSNRVAKIQPSLRIEDATPSPSGDRSRVYYADFESHEVVRIQAGKLALHKGNYIESEKHVQDILRADPRNLYFVYDLPDNRGVHNKRDLFLINCGSQNASFYLCDSSSVSYYHNWKKKYQIAYRVPKMWNYFSIREKLYYFHDQQFFTKIHSGKVTTFPLAGDILKDPASRGRLAEIKLYWNNNSNQGFLSFNKKTYLLVEQKGGDLVTELLIDGFDLNINGVESIYFDKASAKTYLGSRTNGLFVITGHQFQSLTLKGDNFANSVYSQLAFPQNTILTPTGFVLGKDAKTNTTFEKRLPIFQTIDQADKQGILEDENGTIWVKKYEELFRLDKKHEAVTGRWRLISEIRSMIQVQEGKIWLATIDQGLYSIDPSNSESGPKRFNKDSLKNITYLDSYSSNELLVGTTSGLYKADLAKKIYRLIESTRGLSIKSIHKSSQDQVWLTAKGKGVLLMDKDEFLTTFPMDRNRYLASPHCMINDGLGYFWVPTNRGLFQISVQDLLHYSKLWKSATQNKLSAPLNNSVPIELFYKYHTMEEGFTTNEFNGGCQPCGLKIKNGTISLPSLNGFVWFHPVKINHYIPKGDIILDKIELNGKFAPVSGDTVRFTTDPKNINLYFSTANADNDYNLRLSYALLAHGDAVKSTDWFRLENGDFTVRLSSLRSGGHTLQVRKLNGFGINNYSVKKLYIVVAQKWYETAWAIFLFIFLFVLFFLLSIFYYNRYRLSAIAEENRRLEELIERRTETLNQALQAVEESKMDMRKQIHLLSRLVTSISHDIQSPLRYIGFASKTIPDMIAKKQLEKTVSLGATISDLSDRMSGMLRDTLDFIKVEVYGKRLHFEYLNLAELIDTKLEIFKVGIELNGSSFINNVPLSLTAYSDYHFLSIIIHNLLDNAAKYTYKGHIRIYTQATNDEGVELIISNTGTGLSNEMIKNMNMPILNENLEDLVEEGRLAGLGLLIVKEMAELADVTIKVTQTDVTSFHLFFKGVSKSA